MAISSLTLVRKRIGDDQKSETESFPLTAGTTTFQLRYGNVSIFNIYDLDRQSTPLEADTDYSLSAIPGVVTLLYTPDNNNDDPQLTVVYSYYAFSDDELNELIGAYGVNGACAEAIRWLIADSSRLHDYSRGATTESLSQIVKNLQSMLKDYTALGATETGAPSADMKVLKRTNDYYRGTKTYKVDLSRDDSLSI